MDCCRTLLSHSKVKDTASYCVRELRELPSDEDQKLLDNLGFWNLTSRPTKVGRARIDLLKAAAESLKIFLADQGAGSKAPNSLTNERQSNLSSELW